MDTWTSISRSVSRTAFGRARVEPGQFGVRRHQPVGRARQRLSRRCGGGGRVGGQRPSPADRGCFEHTRHVVDKILQVPGRCPSDRLQGPDVDREDMTGVRQQDGDMHQIVPSTSEPGAQASTRRASRCCPAVDRRPSGSAASTRQRSTAPVTTPIAHAYCSPLTHAPQFRCSLGRCTRYAPGATDGGRLQRYPHCRRSGAARPAATIVIPAWNAWEHTERCLESLRPTLGPNRPGRGRGQRLDRRDPRVAGDLRLAGGRRQRRKPGIRPRLQPGGGRGPRRCRWCS